MCRCVCRRLYCSNCLTKTKERILCKRCVVFTTRPLSKIELLKLKAKDLIFYLQSKHISTTGCVGELPDKMSKFCLLNVFFCHLIFAFCFGFIAIFDCRKRGVGEFGVDTRGQFDELFARFPVNANIILKYGYRSR